MDTLKPAETRSRKGSRHFLLAVIGLALICACAPVSAQVQFIRGDADGDGALGLTDVVTLMDYFYSGGTQPPNGCGDPFTFDIGDVNDNEYLTIADPIQLATALFLGGSVPPPTTCGFDLGNQSAGFDVIDPDYEVRVLGPSDRTNLLDPTDRKVSFEMALQVPGPVKAIELYFEYNPAEMSNPTYEGLLPLSITNAGFGVVRVTLTSALDPLALDAGFNRLGNMVFEVAPGVLNPDILWIPTFSDSINRRGTVVDANLNDHHPNYVRVPAPVFIRGDMDGNGIYNVQDLIIWLAVYIGDSTSTLVSVCDGGSSEAMDVNDNEYITIADYQLLATYAFCGSSEPIPHPINCGIDPDNDLHGFDEVDPNFAIRATGFTLIGAGPVERAVEIPLVALSPDPIRGIQFILDLGTTDLSLDTPFFEPAGSVTGLIQSSNRQEGSLLLVTLGTNCDPIVNTGSSQWQDLGTLKLHLFGTELPGPIRFIPEADFGGLVYRTTVVTLDYVDHHPQVFAGENMFRRGDANNQGIPGAASQVDIADPIFLLSYLTGQGPFPPCLDAGDSNDDGKIDFADPIYSLSYLVGQLPPFPSPLDCGYESDIDELNCAVTSCPQE